MEEREWEERRQRAAAARLERERAPLVANELANEGRIEPAPPPLERESGPYTKVIAALLGAVFALVVLDSAYYLLFSRARIVQLAEASRRVLEEHKVVLAQMERALDTERTKAAALAGELTEAHKTNARLERELFSARRDRLTRAPSTPALAAAAAPTVPSIVVMTVPRPSSRPYATPLDDMAKRPAPRTEEAQAAPCHPGDPLCSHL
ncbi:hypothetical protein [Pendulispora albinea]|uniref:Uncharacterized protein n=1 Tax=Pendulispora albinea TaxID=2741071 RepID=A0ABZ2M7F2_9BACT